MGDYKKIRIYKRPEAKEDDGHIADSTGMLKSRPWNVANIPEDEGMETCYPTWEEAWEWATMPPLNRIWLIQGDYSRGGGW